MEFRPKTPAVRGCERENKWERGGKGRRGEADGAGWRTKSRATDGLLRLIKEHKLSNHKKAESGLKDEEQRRSGSLLH